MNNKSIQDMLNEQRQQSEIFKKTEQAINVIISNKERANDPLWRETNKKKNQEMTKDPKWRETNKKKNQEMSKDPKWLKASLDGSEQRRQKGIELRAQGKEKEFRELFGVKDQHSKKTKKQMSASASERWQKTMKAVSAHGVIYHNIYAASEALKIHKDTVVYRIKTKPLEYFYINNK